MIRLSESTYKFLCAQGGHSFDDAMVEHDLWDIEDCYRRAGKLSHFKLEEPSYAADGGKLTLGWFPTHYGKFPSEK